MGDREVIEEGSWVSTVGGGQGDRMLGFYVVVYSDDVIPACLYTDVSLNRGSQSGDWRYASAGPGRAEIDNPAYFIENSSGSDTVTATIGTTSVSYGIEYGSDYLRPDATMPDGP